MKRRWLSPALALGVCALGLMLLALPHEQHGWAQQKTPTDPVPGRDDLLRRLEALERLNGIGPRIDAAQVENAATFAAHARIHRARTAEPVSELPVIANKPTPHGVEFNGCGPHGDTSGGHGDPDLNYLKNREDQADNWIKANFDAVLKLGYPQTVAVHDRKRSSWSAAEKTAVLKYEGLPISIVCYFGWARDEKKESCNCERVTADKSMYDIHTWLLKAPVDIDGNQAPDRSQAIVAEVTPRMKPDHPKWTQTTIRNLARNGTQVRVSGWLMLDHEHPEQVGDTRGTLWEIHPIMDIEVMKNGKWVPIDES